MHLHPPASARTLRHTDHTVDFAVIGGGLSGLCAALSAARAGLRVALVQDRPVLGGNSSSEVRLWTLGATSHMANNNRWAREGGVIDELLVENLARNPEGNPLFWDALLLEKARAESRLILLLNTAVHTVETDPARSGRIMSVEGFCAQDSTRYTVHAPYFCDASGDGVVGFLSGGAFRMGAEAREEFNEGFAPDAAYGELLGHSIYFYTKDTGRPVRYTPPAFALRDIEQIPRWRMFDAKQHGCRLWWIEYGGRLDTVHDTEAIKWELWKIVYGVWDHIKNSGRFPDAETLTLEWVGTIPGKRESRRFEGDYLLRQQDVIGQTEFPDVVSYGGWSIDLHPADGVYADRSGCDQWHSRGVYQIPYRCLYSRNVENLFLAGRVISASHVAFGSTRVMGTSAHSAQAVGVAAAHCLRAGGLTPRALLDPKRMSALQNELMRAGQHLPRRRRLDPEDLAQQARVEGSSEFILDEFLPDGPWITLDLAFAQLLPVAAGVMPRVTFQCSTEEKTALVLELRTSDHPENHTPDRLLARREISLPAGDDQRVAPDFSDVRIDAPRYVFLCLEKNPKVRVATSQARVTGMLSARRGDTPGRGRQAPPQGSNIGVETFEFWCPERRPGGQNLAMRVVPPLAGWPAAAVTDGVARPTDRPHAWVAAPTDPAPRLMLSWSEPKVVKRVMLSFDCDFDHPLESSLLGHPERYLPFCVRSWSLHDADGRELARADDQHLTRAEVVISMPPSTYGLELRLGPTHGGCPPALFEISAFS